MCRDAYNAAVEDLVGTTSFGKKSTVLGFYGQAIMFFQRFLTKESEMHPTKNAATYIIVYKELLLLQPAAKQI